MVLPITSDTVLLERVKATPSTVNFASAPGIPATKTIPGDKGGVAVVVGLIGLAVAIGLAGADWLRMRASRRMNAAL